MEFINNCVIIIDLVNRGWLGCGKILFVEFSASGTKTTGFPTASKEYVGLGFMQ